ncbi:clathrin interactor epsin [Anaeramoeba flamelloides]|uniref:Clathrin interactor epsin n=1 Tax=Anaeramoeba flamelloides TaxID=1746091 RepID=A0AAV7ZXN8_9EUKA|nr:clathrin interactor epsin [Anaeramoeba flamelloides]
MLFEEFTNQSNLLKEIENKVRRVTKNKHKDPKTKEYRVLVKLANENQETAIVLKVLWVRLFRKRKKYISIYRALLLTEYFLLHGKDTLISQIEYFKPKIKKLKTFKSSRWQNDHGLIVRKKAEKIWLLLTDHTLLSELRSEIRTKEENLLASNSSERKHKRRIRSKNLCLSDYPSSKNKKTRISRIKKYSDYEGYGVNSSTSGNSKLLIQKDNKKSKKIGKKKNKKRKFFKFFKK